MNRRYAAYLALGLNAVLFGTYYGVAKDALRRIDPLVFTAVEQLALVPATVALLWQARRQLTGAVVRWGVLLGTCLAGAFIVLASALASASASSTAFFPALSGVLAALLTGLLRWRRPARHTLAAGILSLCGALLLIATAPAAGVHGTLLAAMGTLLFTAYVMLTEWAPPAAPRAALAALELLTMTLVVPVAALRWGDWAAFHPALPHDGLIVLYVAGACTLVPVLLTVRFQAEIAGVTAAFIYTLEPLVGALVAHLYDGEALPLLSYVAGALVVGGTLLHSWGARDRPRPARDWRRATHRRMAYRLAPPTLPTQPARPMARRNPAIR